MEPNRGPVPAPASPVPPAWLEDLGAALSASDLQDVVSNIVRYCEPYQAQLRILEHRDHLQAILKGLTSGLERKSIEPIASLYGLPRFGLQHFLRTPLWHVYPLLSQLRSEVAKEIGVKDASIIIDGSAVEKKGEETVGVKRQYNGHTGKVDNCVIGVYAVYAGLNGLPAIVASEIYLPQEWTENPQRRDKAGIPEDVRYMTQTQIARKILVHLEDLPSAWVVADDEFGRDRRFRDFIRYIGKHYIVDVPSNTQVRRVEPGSCRPRLWGAKELANWVPETDWKTIYVRDGEKGPIIVRACMVDVTTDRENEGWKYEKLVIIEGADGEQKYCLGNAEQNTPLEEFVRREMGRHQIEDVFREAKGEVGMDHYEVRNWDGWYHHMALMQIAHWFLVREKRRLGKKAKGLTVSQIRMAIAPLLMPPPTAEWLAKRMNQTRKRNEEVRRSHYKAKGMAAPPRPLMM